MKHGNIEVICGNGKGKTALAVGKGVIALTRQKSVIMIQFLKGSPKQEGCKVSYDFSVGIPQIPVVIETVHLLAHL